MSDYYDPVHASAQATTSHTHLQHHHQLHPPPLASLSPPSKPQSVFADYHLQHPQLLHHGHQHQLLQNQHQQQLQLQLQQQQQQLRHYRSNSSPQQLLNNQNNYHIASSSSSSPTPTPNFTMQAPPSTSPPLGGKPKATRRRRTVVKADVADDPSDGSSSSGNNQTASPPVASANAPRYVQIKTKFPVARIKRIMQADEDVGKVAQVCPPPNSQLCLSPLPSPMTAFLLFFVLPCPARCSSHRLSTIPRLVQIARIPLFNILPPDDIPVPTRG